MCEHYNVLQSIICIYPNILHLISFHDSTPYLDFRLQVMTTHCFCIELKMKGDLHARMIEGVLRL